MRVTSLIFGVLGAAAAALLGVIWFGDLNAAKELIAAMGAAGADTSEITKLTWATYLLLAGGALGIAGGVLGFKGKGKLASAILIVAAVAPAVFVPKALVFTFLLGVGGIFAFFAKPKTQAAPQPMMAHPAAA